MRRREDPRLVTGRGRFTGDIVVPGMLHAVFVRSSIAHGRLLFLETAEAAAMPGVVAVLTAADLALDPVMEIGVFAAHFGRPPLAGEVVRFVGEPLALVVAESAYQAADAALAVSAEYEPLPVLVDPVAAAEPGARRLFEEAEDNVAFAVHPGEGDILAGADVVVRGRFVNQRLAPVPLEGHAIVAAPAEDGRTRIWVSLQSPFNARDEIAGALSLEDGVLHVISPDVGGGFGAKIHAAPEHVVVVAASRRLGRAVRWVDTRSENLVSMWHGRGQVQELEIGATSGGDLVGFRARVIAEAGAYPGLAAFLPIYTAQMLPNVYTVPAVDFGSRSVVTNTNPTSAFRGAGRPEAITMIERGMDLLAARLALDPADLRRRNLIGADRFPHRTPSGSEYDSGNYEGALDAALAAAGYEELRQDQARRRQEGTGPLLGIGICCYVEVSAVGESSEYSAVEVRTDGSAVVTAGVMPTGQGHETSLSQVAAAELGLPLASVEVILGDTDRVPRGGGTYGSRSMQLGGSAVARSAAEVRRQARALAANLLEAAEEDIVQFGDGRFGVAGMPSRSLGWAELAQAAPVPLRSAGDFSQANQSFPFGCHVSVVSVDTETGEVRLLRHIAVDDCGRIINPKLAEGQVQGGIAQGVAQALFEEVLYDGEGNPRSSSLLDYSLPTANELPVFETSHTITPTPLNPLGAKGIGESGTIGATAAVWNAVLDALAHLGIDHIDMPLTPDRVWAALDAVGYGGSRGEAQ